MNNTREAISVALFNQLQNNSTLAALISKFSRSPKVWTDISPADQPALFLFRLAESARQNQALGLTKYLLEYRILVYLRADTDPSTTVETLINNVMDAIDGALQSTPKGEAQTLGGLVTNAWIEGESFLDNGALDQQCAILLPVKVLSGI